MPFVIVYGIPKETKKDVLIKLRRELVASVVKNMEVPQGWVRPFFQIDMLDEPVEEADGCSTIYVTLDTAMFSGNLDQNSKERATQTLKELTEIISTALNEKYEVETFIDQLNPELKALLRKVK